MKPTPSREEWDFRAQPLKGTDWTNGIKYDFLQEQEVVRCWLYEYTRTRNLEQELALERRGKAPNPKSFDSLLMHYFLSDPNGKLGIAPVLDWFYKLWPEWPTKPFLSISRKERERRYKAMWGSNPKRALQLIQLNHIYKFINSVVTGQLKTSQAGSIQNQPL